MIDNGILRYFHCAKCLAELPVGEAPMTWARVNVGWTVNGFQVWCVRHDENIVAVHFLGQKLGFDRDPKNQSSGMEH